MTSLARRLDALYLFSRGPSLPECLGPSEDGRDRPACLVRRRRTSRVDGSNAADADDLHELDSLGRWHLSESRATVALEDCVDLEAAKPSWPCFRIEGIENCDERESAVGHLD